MTPEPATPSADDRTIPASAIGPHSSPGYWLHHAALAWRREMGARLRDLDLTPTQFDVLAALRWLSRDGAATQQMVADLAGIDRMMTSKVVQALERRGLLERSDHATDRRAIVLRLTPEGLALLTTAIGRTRALDRALFGDRARSVALRESLAAVIDLIEAQGAARDQTTV